MATSEIYPKPIPGKVYTLNEAIELQKERDRFATTSPPIKWVNAKTGTPVSIGYT